MANLLFESVASMPAAFAEHNLALAADIPNYTNAQPVIQISDTLANIGSQLWAAMFQYNQFGPLELQRIFDFDGFRPDPNVPSLTNGAELIMSRLRRSRFFPY